MVQISKHKFFNISAVGISYKKIRACETMDLQNHHNIYYKIQAKDSNSLPYSRDSNLYQ